MHVDLQTAARSAPVSLFHSRVHTQPTVLSSAAPGTTENVEDVVELPENPAAGAMGKCVRSIRALHSVCGLYGESSEACKETKAAHEHQCQSLLGESGNGDGLGCRNNNFDTEKRVSRGI